VTASTEVRSLITAGLFALIGSGVVYSIFTPFAQAQRGSVVRATQFELVDRKGVRRALLGLSGDDQSHTYFYLMDSSGRPRLEVNVSPGNENPEVTLLNVEGHPVSNLSGGMRPSKSGLSPIRPVAKPKDKGRRYSYPSADIQNLQHQIDEVRDSLNYAIGRLNAVSH
jgi:hypothetical protein